MALFRKKASEALSARMVGPIASFLGPGEEVQMRPLATFRMIPLFRVFGFDAEFRAGAYLTNRTLFLVDERSQTPMFRLPLAGVTRADMRDPWICLVVRTDDGTMHDVALKISPRATGRLFLSSVIASRRAMDETSESGPPR